jgi:ubiquinone/menaquinone biosynthesis C-methylase UbiE
MKPLGAELCSGTRAQTTRFIQGVGEDGRVVALDVSQQALETLVGKVPGEYRPRVTVVQSGMDELNATLTEREELGRSCVVPNCDAYKR